MGRATALRAGPACRREYPVDRAGQGL